MAISKDNFIVCLENLAQKLLNCKDETVVLTPEGKSRISATEINELGKVIINKFIPILKSKLGAVIYRVIYTGYIRILE